MKTQIIGQSAILSTRLAYGCMRITSWQSQLTDEGVAQARKAVLAAYEAGYRLFDHADIYGFGTSEEAFGVILRENPHLRKDIVIANKCGIRFAESPTPDAPYRYDFAAEYIIRACEDSLKRMGVETFDIYQLHRPDFLMDPDEVAGALDNLHRQGKIREFGVSNFLPSQVTALQSRLSRPLLVNQVAIHPGRLACFTDGTLDQCLAEGITPLAYSPVGGGMFATGGTVPPEEKNREACEKVLVVLDELAGKYNVTRTAVTLAWLLKHPTKIVPIVGSTNPQHIREAAAADNVEMSREDWYKIMTAAWGERLP